MLARWTGRNILFIPECGNTLPCRAYISLPFDQTRTDVDEHLDAGLIHKLPRIFTFSIVLEIALGRALEISR